MVSGVGRGIGVLDGGGDRRRGMGCFGVNLGHPIVPVGILMHRCVQVREPIMLSFGVVSGVVPGTDVRHGGPRGSRERGGF